MVVLHRMGKLWTVISQLSKLLKNGIFRLGEFRYYAQLGELRALSNLVEIGQFLQMQKSRQMKELHQVLTRIGESEGERMALRDSVLLIRDYENITQTSHIDLAYAP